MLVIFLDIDGVLNSEAYVLTLEKQHYALGHAEPARPKRETTCDCFKLYHQIDRDAVARVNHIVASTGAKIVISSTWRKLFDPPVLAAMLAEHGLVGEIIGETPEGPDYPGMLATYGQLERVYRGYEIDYWLRQHPEVDRFVILDDGSDMVMHKHRLVQTDCQEGLLDEHCELAIHMLTTGVDVDDAMRALTTDDDYVAEMRAEHQKHQQAERAAVSAFVDQIVARGLMMESSIEIAAIRRLVHEEDCEARAAKQPGSSVGLHCDHDIHLREGHCPERLELRRKTAVQPTHEDDYQHLFGATHSAAVLLGWRCYKGGWWCPAHVVAKNLARKRCLSACPACSCVGGPWGDAVDGLIVNVETAEPEDSTS